MPNKILPDSRCELCGEPSAFRPGRMTYCIKHSRFHQMQEGAARSGKVVPNVSQLEAMLSPTMTCPDCGVTMCWRSSESRKRVACIQHYRDGQLAIVCLSCNSHHAALPGDLARDGDGTQKACRKCNTVKLLTEFYANKNNAISGMQAWCKACTTACSKAWAERNRERLNAATSRWRKEHREQWNAVMRNNRARRKAKEQQNVV